MSISKDIFIVNTVNVIKAHNIISSRLRLIKDVLASYGKYLTFCNDVILYLERLDDTKSIANRIQRKMEAFRILENIERKHILAQKQETKKIKIEF